MVYVNKMDTMGADFFRCIKMLQDRLHANGVAIQLPIGQEDTFRGIVDLVDMTLRSTTTTWATTCALSPSPRICVRRPRSTTSSSGRGCCRERRRAHGEVPRGRGDHREELKAAIRKETIANTLVPVCLRLFLQEQGRSEAAGRYRRLYARPYRCRGHQGRTDPETTGRRSVSLPTTSPSPLWPSRS